MTGGTTQVAGVIGEPVRHSLSPAIHNAAFATTGLDWVFVAFPVPASALGAAVAGVRALGIRGLSVTMPHKNAIIDKLDRLSPTAARLDAVNTVVSRGGDLVGDNTDGGGFVDWIRGECQFEPGGKRCVVLGAGGAARAVVLALAEAGAAQVTVLNRTLERGGQAAQLAGSAGRVGTGDDVAGADLVINATPLGMTGANRDVGWGVEIGALGKGQLVVDLVYDPRETLLIRTARRQGARAYNGVGMLIHQAARAFELWTGEQAPIEAMSEAVRQLGSGDGASADCVEG
ncbi:MAG: shikimate dehydrogenase [Acidimicrobiales bacterium]